MNLDKLILTVIGSAISFLFGLFGYALKQTATRLNEAETDVATLQEKSKGLRADVQELKTNDAAMFKKLDQINQGIADLRVEVAKHHKN